MNKLDECSWNSKLTKFKMAENGANQNTSLIVGNVKIDSETSFLYKNQLHVAFISGEYNQY